jgi:hypothetical protein
MFLLVACPSSPLGGNARLKTTLISASYRGMQRDLKCPSFLNDLRNLDVEYRAVIIFCILFYLHYFKLFSVLKKP